jgi:hypothetical protein
MYLSKKLVASLIAIVAVAAGSAAFAAIPDAGGVVHACYDKQSGVLRATDTATNLPKGCTAKEAALTWNQQGPQGVAGPQGQKGDVGATGPQGPKGDAGASDVSILSKPGDQGLTNAQMTPVGHVGPLQGKYLVSAKLEYWSSYGAGYSYVNCTLYGGGIQQDQSIMTSGDGAPLIGTFTNLTLTGVLDNGGYASVICTGNDGDVSNLIITATKVTNIAHVS